jgi:hypothetical protein
MVMFTVGAPPAFPRMSQDDAADRVRQLSGQPLDVVASLSTVDVSTATYYQTASDRVVSSDLLDVQMRVRELALEHGYPTQQARGRSLQFDQKLSILLFELLNILPADAADEGVWSFFTLNVCPDVALWRFPNDARSDGGIRENYERLVGKPRNIFRRAWWRAYVLGPDVSSRLLEDESVGIMERPSIGGEPRLARCVASTQLRFVDRGSIRSRQDLLRDAMKRIRRRMGHISIYTLDENQMPELVLEAFEAAIVATSQFESTSQPTSEISRFQEAVGSLWGLLEPAVTEVEWPRMTELLAEIRSYRDELPGNRQVAQIIVGDLERLIEGWDTYTAEARAVVHAAASYFLDIEDDIPDHLPTGLDDDNEVVSAAYLALRLVR